MKQRCTCPSCQKEHPGFNVFLCQNCGYCADEKREKYETLIVESDKRRGITLVKK